MLKLHEFKKELKKSNIQTAIFFGNDPNIKYFSNFGDFSCLIISTNNPPKILVPEMNLAIAKKESNIQPTKWPKDITKYLNQNITSKTIGLNKNSITLNQYKGIKKAFKNKKIKDVSQLTNKLRSTKTAEEVQKISYACKITDKIFKKTLNQIKKRKLKTETDVSSFIVHETLQKGLELAFDPIVASGQNSKYPHHKPMNTKLKKGFCLIDMGVKYKGYCSDMSRTIYIGKPTKEEFKIYNHILTVQKTLIKNSRINKKCNQLFKEAEELLKQKLIHGLGHGLGIDIHEAPSIKEKSKETLKENTIFTIEPGIYNKQGIRIEDTILLTKKGPKILTKTKKRLIKIIK
ncbi:aminopeptidase P family protein [Candidatus Woesearchaeota archaeon]|nr:aminopeptidase P family protein [Candidatus Woesearchaeota archaeon]